LGELVLDRELGIDLPPACRDHRGQPVIGLRADHKIDDRRTAQDLGPFGLGDAARDAHLEVRFVGLQLPQAAKVGVQLLRRLFADVAGVEKDHVRLFRHVGRDIALGAHGFAMRSLS
jgi:hypothetical protein